MMYLGILSAMKRGVNMKAKMVYECEFCNFQSESHIDVAKHEAAHYGLTLEDYVEWNRLDQMVKRRSHVYDGYHNSRTEADLDSAIKELLAFEDAHNLTGRRCFLHG